TVKRVRNSNKVTYMAVFENPHGFSEFTLSNAEDPSVPTYTPVTGISLDKSTIKLNVGDAENLSATITPNNATNKAISWSSSDSSVATVENGTIKALKCGTTTITAKTNDGNFTVTCEVTVNHSYAEKVIAPTCTEKGYTSHTCSCGDTYKTDEKAALGHDWNEGVITKEATTTATGVKTYTCKRVGCGETKTETIPALVINIHFDDIADNAWYNESVYYLVAKGIINGMDENTFAPEEKITRAQFATMLAKASGEDLTAYQTNSVFDDVTESWAVPYINWAYSKGIINGYEDGTFRSKRNVSRQEIAVMIGRFADYKKIPMKQVEEKINFNDDADISNWAKEYVYDLQQANIINGYEEKDGYTFKPQNTAKRSEAAKMLYEFLIQAD
ncbi:MAG: S-layer homology domain-containing protein, partial [Firmicutes bacterium]|nr:S-layer homology domain-containing protein [Bacillota bacterium]